MVDTPRPPSRLDDCALEVLVLVCQSLDERALMAASAVALQSTLSQAARAALGGIATQTVTQVGLAWAAELALATGVQATGSRLPPRLALRHLPVAGLVELLRSTTTWLADEEGRYKAAAAWLRCWRWWPLPDNVASAVLGVVRLERMPPCARQRAYEDAAQWANAREASWAGACQPRPDLTDAAAGVWCFGFSVPMPERARPRRADGEGEDEGEDADGGEEEEGEDEGQLQFVWGSQPLWVAGTYLHAEVQANCGMADDEVVVGLKRIRGAEPKDPHSLWGAGGTWTEGFHLPVRTAHTPSGVGFSPSSMTDEHHHLSGCALCRSEAEAAIASSHRFEIRLQFGVRVGASLTHLVDRKEDEGDDEGDDEDEGAAFVLGGQPADASRAETWMPGSGFLRVVPLERWEAAAESVDAAGTAQPRRMVRLLVAVHVVAVGERLCTACGAPNSRGACSGCMGITQWCPVRYCSLACQAAAASRHQPACRAVRKARKRAIDYWSASPHKAWIVGADGVGAFVETGPAGPPLCNYEEDWRHTNSHPLVEEALVRRDGDAALVRGADLVLGRPEHKGAAEAFHSLKCMRDKFGAWMRSIHPHRLSFYSHNGQRMSVRSTTVETVGSLMRAEEVALLTHLFSSDLCSPHAEEDDEDGRNGGEVKVTNNSTVVHIRPAPLPPTALVDWEESMYCKCGHGHKTPLGVQWEDECTCRLSPPPPTPKALRELSDVISAVVFAGRGLDWSEPPMPDEANDEPFSSLVQEALAELESSWETLLRRASGVYSGEERRAPAFWWVPRAVAFARQRNEKWRMALRGSKTKSKSSKFLLFDGTGILLNLDRLEQLPGDGPVWFDAHGLAHVDEAPEADRAPACEPSPASSAELQPAAPHSQSTAAIELEAATQDAVLRPGQRVRLSGLQQRADLNGGTGTIVSAPTAGRVRVDLDDGDEFVRVKMSNLTVLVGGASSSTAQASTVEDQD